MDKATKKQVEELALGLLKIATDMAPGSDVDQIRVKSADALAAAALFQALSADSQSKALWAIARALESKTKSGTAGTAEDDED